MESRYSIFKESETGFDSEDDERYPDPLSIDFSAFTFTEPPIRLKVTEDFIERPYKYTAPLYGSPELEDIILNINNIPHMSTLLHKALPFKRPSIAGGTEEEIREAFEKLGNMEGAEIVLPSRKDLEVFLTKYDIKDIV